MIHLLENRDSSLEVAVVDVELSMASSTPSMASMVFPEAVNASVYGAVWEEPEAVSTESRGLAAAETNEVAREGCRATVTAALQALRHRIGARTSMVVLSALRPQ